VRSLAHISSGRSIIVILLLGGAGPARALQPLSGFLAGARSANVDNREAAMAAVELQEEAAIAFGRLLPSATVRGSYTRNQFAAVFPVQTNPSAAPKTLVIQPFNQWDLFLQADAPLVDVAGWARTGAARGVASAAKQSARATVLDVETRVARFYYALVGAEALRQSAERTLQAAQANADLTRERRAGGIATALDVERAQAEVERDRQSIADVELQVSLARRALITLTGVTPSGPAEPAEDDLHEEAPLDQWEATPDAVIPSLAAAGEQTRAAAISARGAKLSLLPTLTASFIERITNATSFIGQPDYYTFSLNLFWRLDAATINGIRAQSSQAQLAAIRQERLRLAVHDQIYEAWQRVKTGIAKSRAARAQAKASQLASEFATERYANGAGTQLDLVQAQRDAFAADVGRVQADADLSFARALLRLTAGTPLDKADHSSVDKADHSSVDKERAP
jgi:outer membrane protein TolC